MLEITLSDGATKIDIKPSLIRPLDKIEFVEDCKKFRQTLLTFIDKNGIIMTIVLI